MIHLIYLEAYLTFLGLSSPLWYLLKLDIFLGKFVRMSELSEVGGQVVLGPVEKVSSLTQKYFPTRFCYFKT